MKKNLLILAMMAFATLGFTACNNSDDEKTDEDIVLSTPDFKDDAIKLKFDRLVEYDADFNISELELTESGFYFIKLEKKITRAGNVDYKYLFDVFTRLVNKGEYKLNGFGSISIKENGGKYTVTLNFNGLTITVDATKIVAGIVEGQKTDNLCRGWEVVSTRVQIDGVSAFYQENGCNLNSILAYIKQHATLEDEVESNQVVTRVIFSDNGTFSLVYANGDIDKATWKWVDAAKGTLSYSWEDSDNMGYSFINGQASVSFKPVQLKLAGTVKNKNGEDKAINFVVNLK